MLQIENINLTDEYINKEVLLLPFKVSYIDDDVKFYSDDKDEVWSLNMKKSLATLFQLKRNVYEEGAFAVKEVSYVFNYIFPINFLSYMLANFIYLPMHALF